MRIVCQQTILMKYHALFLKKKKKQKKKKKKKNKKKTAKLSSAELSYLEENVHLLSVERFCEFFAVSGEFNS